MTQRQGASLGRSFRPKVKIEAKKEKTKRSFSLTKEASKNLDSYVTFLESHLGGKVTPDQVIEERILDLTRDKLWKDWQSQQKSAGTDGIQA